MAISAQTTTAMVSLRSRRAAAPVSASAAAIVSCGIARARASTVSSRQNLPGAGQVRMLYGMRRLHGSFR